MKRKYTAHEMRKMADDFENYADIDESDITEMLRQAADMIEHEATREKSSRVGNAEKMREALKAIIDTIDEWRANGEMMEHWQYSELFDIADTALSAPPRNCDRYTIAEALRKYGFPTKSNPWGEKEWIDFCEWLFAEAKGATDGSK